MTFISFKFLLFIVAALAVYYIVPKKVQWIVLLIFSLYYIFYSNEIKLSIIFLLTVLFTYCAGLALTKSKNGKGVLLGVLIIDIGVWLCLKESNFFLLNAGIIAEAMGHRGGVSVTTENFSILAPIGISYYTFSMLGYLMDVYWKIQKPQRNFFKFVLFVGYFPILISGPIVKYREMENELFEKHLLNYRSLYFGLQRVIWGLFKKLVISERAAIIVNAVWNDVSLYKGIYIWIASFLFVLQLYTDFSGCIDIVMGVSEMFGITLPENFNLPFISRNISEWWRRWHITLGSWVRDYMFYPILKSFVWQKFGKRCKKILTSKNKLANKVPVWCGLFFTWMFIGLWHGGSYNYIFGVGLFYWALIVIGEIFEPFSKRIVTILRINTECFSWHFFQSLRTFAVFMISSVFWRSYSGVTEAMNVLRASVEVFNPNILVDGSLYNLGLQKMDYSVLIVGIAILSIAGILKMYVNCSVREWLEKQNIGFRCVTITIVVMAVILFGVYGPGVDSSEFIYQQF